MVYLADGGICGCETPGAPSLEVILLRSGQIAEGDWNAAFTAAAVAGRPLTGELVGHGLLGAGETEALLRTTLADAFFAVLSGHRDGWTAGGARFATWRSFSAAGFMKRRSNWPGCGPPIW
jgi:hypothetical protein